MKELISGDKYKHFKGDTYVIHSMGIDTSTDKPIVLYYNINDENETLFSRSVESFLSDVDKEKYPDATQVKRFEKINTYQMYKIGANKYISNFLPEGYYSENLESEFIITVNEEISDNQDAKDISDRIHSLDIAKLEMKEPWKLKRDLFEVLDDIHIATSKYNITCINGILTFIKKDNNYEV